MSCRVPLLCCVLFCLSSLRADDILLPLLSYRDGSPPNTKYFFNPWGGNKQAQATHDTALESLCLSYEQSSVTLSFPDLGAQLEQLAKQYHIRGVYLKYRIHSQDGHAVLQFAAKENYTSNLGLRRSGQWEIVKVRPGGWSRSGKPLIVNDLKNIYVIFYGSGKIDIRELGLVGRKQDEALTPASERPLAVSAARAVATTAPQLDGRIDENEWTAAALIPLLPVNADTANPTTVFIQASTAGLHCGAICQKQDMGRLRNILTSNTTNVWEDESLEFYFDVGKSGRVFRKIGVNANGIIGGISSALDESGIETKTRILADRWEMEMLVPWAFLGADADQAATYGFNVSRNCYDSGTMHRSSWTTTVWNDVAGFGEIQLLPPHPSKKPAYKLHRNGPGDFLLESESAQPSMTTRLWVFTPDRRRYFYGHSLDGGRYVPFTVPITDYGQFRIAIETVAAKTLLNRQVYHVQEVMPKTAPPLRTDDLALFPLPKIFRMGESVLPLRNIQAYTLIGDKIAQVAVMLSQELQDYYGVALPSAPQSKMLIGLATEPAIQTALKKHDLEKDFAQVRGDGFAISVTPDAVLVAAILPRGLLFGTRALLELLKMRSGDVGEALFPTVTVVDWPRLDNRFFIQMMGAYYHQNKYDPDFFCRTLEQFPQRFRCSSYYFSVDDYYQWQCAPIKINQAWTPEEFISVVDFLNDRYAVVNPALPSHGHMEWWLGRYPKLFQHLLEDGGKQVVCTRHPETYPLFFAMYDELMDICGRNPDCQPEVFYAFLDEVRWETAMIQPEKRCPRCAGIPKNQLYVENIRKLNDYWNGRGMRMLMCSDMVTEAHNGLNQFKCAEIVDDIPRNVILGHWSDLDIQSIPKFKAMGFENWKNLTGYHDNPLGEDSIGGMGIAICTYNWWLSRNRCDSNAAYGLMAQALVMNNAWNDLPDYANSWRGVVNSHGEWLMRNWSRKPMPHAGSQLSVLDLADVAKHPVSGDNSWFGQADQDLSTLDFERRELAGIPLRFARNDGRVSCVMAEDSEVRINVARPIGTLLFLHAAHLPVDREKDYFKRSNYRDWDMGPEIARYTVNYSDGTTVDFSIYYGWNISEWLSGADRNSVFSRYLADSRALWTGKTNAAAAERGEDDIVLYQYEWVNPQPEKKVSAVLLRGTDPTIRYALLAMSCRNVKQP